jgi:hypothetical protein
MKSCLVVLIIVVLLFAISLPTFAECPGEGLESPYTQTLKPGMQVGDIFWERPPRQDSFNHDDGLLCKVLDVRYQNSVGGGVNPPDGCSFNITNNLTDNFNYTTSNHACSDTSNSCSYVVHSPNEDGTAFKYNDLYEYSCINYVNSCGTELVPQSVYDGDYYAISGSVFWMYAYPNFIGCESSSNPVTPKAEIIDDTINGTLSLIVDVAVSNAYSDQFCDDEGLTGKSAFSGYANAAFISTGATVDECNVFRCDADPTAEGCSPDDPPDVNPNDYTPDPKTDVGC